MVRHDQRDAAKPRGDDERDASDLGPNEQTVLSQETSPNRTPVHSPDENPEEAAAGDQRSAAPGSGQPEAAAGRPRKPER